MILNTQIEEAYGWRAVLFGYGTLVLVGVTLLSRLVRDRPEPYGLRPDGDPPEESASTEHSTAHHTAETDTGLTLRAVFRTKEFWLFTGYLSGTFAVNSAVQGHMIPYFQQDIGPSPLPGRRWSCPLSLSSAVSDASAAAICWIGWTIASCWQSSPR